jgi:hypothetical protein
MLVSVLTLFLRFDGLLSPSVMVGPVQVLCLVKSCIGSGKAKSISGSPTFVDPDGPMAPYRVEMSLLPGDGAVVTRATSSFMVATWDGVAKAGPVTAIGMVAGLGATLLSIERGVGTTFPDLMYGEFPESFGVLKMTPLSTLGGWLNRRFRVMVFIFFFPPCSYDNSSQSQPQNRRGQAGSLEGSVKGVTYLVVDVLAPPFWDNIVL